MKFLLYIVILFFSISSHAKVDSLDEKKSEYIFGMLFTSSAFLATGITYGINKSRFGVEYGLHYPVLISDLFARSIGSKIGINFGVFYQDTPVSNKWHLSFIARFRLIYMATYAKESFFAFQSLAPPFYKFGRYWFETNLGIRLTKSISPRSYFCIEIKPGYLFEYRINLDGLVNDYEKWDRVFRLNSLIGLRYDLFK